MIDNDLLVDTCVADTGIVETGVKPEPTDEAPGCEHITYELIDTHCHFDADEFADKRSALWQACHACGVKKIIIPGVEPKQWQVAAQLSQTYSGIHYAVGIHPWWIEKILPDTLTQGLTQGTALADSHDWHISLNDPSAIQHCVAIGECGLDGRITASLAQQQALFELHLQLAQDYEKPLIIHSVKAHAEILHLLKQYRPPKGGVIHAFSGSLQQAQHYWQLGFYLGIGGTITYERAQKTRHAVTHMPLEALVLETDAPYMPLAGHQGEPNRPDYLPTIAQTLAHLRNQPLDIIARQTTHNAKLLFGI